jgi:hypothetical protein
MSFLRNDVRVFSSEYEHAPIRLDHFNRAFNPGAGITLQGDKARDHIIEVVVDQRRQVRLSFLKRIGEFL